MKLHCDGTTQQETTEKRGMFISDCMNMNQQYHYASPETKLKMFSIYNQHFSGSNLWDFSSKIFQQLCNSYNTNIRVIFDIHRETSCWLVEKLASGRLAKQIIYGRFIKFISSLQENRRLIVKSLGQQVINDVHSLT